MSLFAEQACFPAFTLRHFVFLSRAVEAELFLQENLPSFAYIRHLIAFVWPVVSAVTPADASQLDGYCTQGESREARLTG